ncbi:TetR/AcrR family transcriptional regulator [Pendulispora brunnea]|uniref:TetR/AcrR family transcriptional regulator n=1 Tax=Pendulispora brunnea TaxID=2905690 RepID=A0ABZ2KC59_9BACT
MAKRPAIAPRKQPVQARSHATVEAILQATVRVLTKVGYDRTSTNKVAEAAGVSVGSLYQYFPSKEALAVALAERYHERLFAVMFERLREVATLPIHDAVRSVIWAIVDAHRADPVVHRILTEQIPRIGKLGEILKDIEVRATPIVRQYLEARQREIRVKDLDAAAYVVVVTVQVLADRISHNKDPLELSRRVDATCELVSRYLVDDNAERKRS